MNLAPGISANASRRERRKAETRRRLLDAARSLFVQRGYEATRPQDIAREADLASGTFYVHFADRREIFEAFTEQAGDELAARVRQHAGNPRDFGERIRRSFEAICGYADENPGVLRAAFADPSMITAEEPNGHALRDQLATELAADLRRSTELGEIRDDFDPMLIACGMVGLIQHALSFGHRRGVERDVLIENLTRFCVRGLTPDAATGGNFRMSQLAYTEEELMRSHDYARPQVVAGHRLHGGFDAAGRYIPPRCLVRGPAIEAWTEQLRARGGDLLHADSSLLAGVRYPNEAQMKLLIREGLGQTFWNTLTITGQIEARGRILAEMVFPEFQKAVVEDVSSMGIGHLNKGLLRAHGIDEGGEPERGIGGHDVMWFALRDLAFGETDYPEPPVPENISRPETAAAQVPEIPQEFERTVYMLLNLLMIEFRAERGFSFTETLLRDPDLFADRRPQAEEAADIVNRIRVDEEIHVTSLRLYLGELRGLTFRTNDGGTISGRDLVDPLWEGIVHWATVEQPRLLVEQQRKLMNERILEHPEGERILRAFDALEA